ncbi:uncharacterized protein N0V89_010264 [Didymosphaeria variabile]|uniref:Uncharacterized protein n=1 Tax=Didymosphaeria variabile TaxID=1932322 RepID=A0A9W8XAZ8_9PLEO|nr:uncharacterized protein N0V89_010264 [Didymosphaeria variabile]KAJ4346335.1 hypothetical protein N0V89_010264 [Didymosphaeria variabile]
MPFLAGFETVVLVSGLAFSTGIAIPWVTTVEKRELRDENAELRAQGRGEISYLKYVWHSIWHEKKPSQVKAVEAQGGDVEAEEAHDVQTTLGMDETGQLIVVKRRKVRKDL